MSQSLNEKLAEEYGFEDVDQMLENYIIDSVVPGICTRCEEYTTEIEPDSDSGWCEECQGNYVTSCLVLAGVI